MVEIAIFNVQRAINPKVRNPELWFKCSALLYIYVRFHLIYIYGFHTRVHGRNVYIQFSKGNNSRTRKPKVIVHVFCTLFLAE